MTSDSPQTINDNIATLSKLIKDNSERLSAKQIDGIQSKSNEFQNNLQNRTNEAVKWLNKLQLDSESDSDWPMAVKEMGMPHLFLPDTEKPRFEGIRSSLTEKIKVKAEQDELKLRDSRSLAIIESQSKKGSVEELQSRLQIIESLEVHLEDSKVLKNAVVTVFKEAIAQAISQRNLLNSKQEDAEKIASITPSQNTGLIELRRISALIEQITFALPDSKTKANELRKQVAVAIKQLVEFVSALEMNIDNSVSQKELANITEQINRKRFQYTDTPEFNLIVKSSDRANQLLEFINLLTNINIERVTLPIEVTEINNSLNTWVTTYAEFLSQKHRDLVQQLRQHLETKVLKLQQVADNWLKARSAHLQIEELPRLLKELDSPPAFLTADKVLIVDALKQKTLTQLDGDEVNQVIHHFQKITDLQKRHETIDRLQKLL